MGDLTRWARGGDEERHERGGLITGLRTNAVRVMVKRLTGRPWAGHIAQVPRDRPDAD